MVDEFCQVFFGPPFSSSKFALVYSTLQSSSLQLPNHKQQTLFFLTVISLSRLDQATHHFRQTIHHFRLTTHHFKLTTHNFCLLTKLANYSLFQNYYSLFYDNYSLLLASYSPFPSYQLLVAEGQGCLFPHLHQQFQLETWKA